MNQIFLEITLALILAGATALVVSFLKQPSILAYILTGLILGPLGFSKLTEGETLHGLSEIGITLLLFMVGLELDINDLKKIGRSAGVVGIFQVIITSLLGFILSKLLGFSTIHAAYLGLALTFSSTIIVVKLLSEKKDLYTLYGKLAVGIFVVQDIIAVFLLVFLQGLGTKNDQILLPMSIAMLKLVGLLFIVYIHSKYVFPFLLRFVGKSQELLLTFSLAWALGFATLVAMPIVGFNLAIGGFLAGVALANTAVHFEISAKIKPLRDFFIMLFFIVLGSQLVFTGWQQIMIPTLIFSVFVILLKPLLTMVLLGGSGFTPRTSFLTGLSVGQISEFSLILGTLGLALGHITMPQLSIITFTGIITMTISSYVLTRGASIYEFLKPGLTWLNFKGGSAERNIRASALRSHCILIGAHRLGERIVETLQKIEMDFVVVDFNPDIAERLERAGVHAICGDITDTTIQDLCNLRKAKLVISTINDIHVTLALTEALTQAGSKAKLIVTASDEKEAKQLYYKEVDYVLLPHFIGADHLRHILENKNPQMGLKNLRKRHYQQLQKIL